jgi:hypothetical protein
MKKKENNQKQKAKPKKTRQGSSINTKLSAAPKTKKRSKYRGQGR